MKESQPPTPGMSAAASKHGLAAAGARLGRLLPSAENGEAVLLPFLAQRLALVAVVALVAQQLPWLAGWRALPSLPALDLWLRWDSSYYMLVAYHGYGPSIWGDASAFFPLYPALVRLVAVFVPVPVAALLVASAAAQANA